MHCCDRGKTLILVFNDSLRLIRIMNYSISIVIFNKNICFPWRLRQILNAVISINIWHSGMRDAV